MQIHISYKFPTDGKNVVFGFLSERFWCWGVESECHQRALTGCLFWRGTGSNQGVVCVYYLVRSTLIFTDDSSSAFILLSGLHTEMHQR